MLALVRAEGQATRIGNAPPEIAKLVFEGLVFGKVRGDLQLFRGLACVEHIHQPRLRHPEVSALAVL
jgi:hypothetical protein